MSQDVSVRDADPEVLKPRRVWWASGRFGKLLLGQSVSAVGSQITFLALPLIAVMTLGATPGAMGVLGAVDNLPYLLVGLWVGVFVDRHARRTLMIASDLLRAVAVVSVPVAAVLGWLSFAQLCIVAFVVGLGNIVFDVACQAHLPELVASDRLVGANGALQTSASLSMVGAPGLVGVLIKLLGAPVAMVIDTCTYVVSILCIGAIREPERALPSAEGSTWDQVVEGWRLVRGDARLVGIAGGASMISIAMNAAFAVLVFFLANQLGLDAGMIGLVFLAFGVGGAIGAMAVSGLAATIGSGRVLAGAPLVAAAGLGAFVALDGAGEAVRLFWVFAGAVAMGAGMLAFSVLAAGVRQVLAPAEARGRVLGTLRFVELGSMPVGSVIGGIVGELAGSNAAMVTAAGLLSLATAWILATPLRSLAGLPEQDGTGTVEEGVCVGGK
jgi:MFS family permease